MSFRHGFIGSHPICDMTLTMDWDADANHTKMEEKVFLLGPLLAFYDVRGDMPAANKLLKVIYFLIINGGVKFN